MLPSEDPNDLRHGVPEVPCTSVVIAIELSRVGHATELHQLEALVASWAMHVRSNPAYWRTPANATAPPPWSADVFLDSPMTFVIELDGAYFSSDALTALLDRLEAMRQGGLPVVQLRAE